MRVDVARLIVGVKAALEALPVGVGDWAEPSVDVFIVLGPVWEVIPSDEEFVFSLFQERSTLSRGYRIDHATVGLGRVP